MSSPLTDPGPPARGGEPARGGAPARGGRPAQGGPLARGGERAQGGPLAKGSPLARTQPKKLVGWRRVASPTACDFCVMLTSRGAVYSTADSADFEAHTADDKGRGGTCQCTVEPVWEHQADPPEIVALREEFQAVTRDFVGARAKIVAWRRYWRGGRSAGVRVGAAERDLPFPTGAPDLAGMKVAELRDLARRNGVTIPPLSTRADIVRLLEAANVRLEPAAADLANLPSLAGSRLATRRARAELLERIEAEPGTAIGLSEDLDALISQGLVRKESGQFVLGETRAGRAQQTATRYFLTDQAKAEIAALRSGVAAPVPLARQSIAELRALARERGVTVPSGARKADLVRLLSEEAPTGRAPLTGAEVQRASRATRLTETQRKAVDRYGGDGSYVINADLREHAGRVDLLTERNRQTVETLDTVFARSELPQPAILHRKMDISRGPLGDLANADRDLTGFTWTEDAYSSTSIAERLTGPRHVQVRIFAPKGTRAISHQVLDSDEVLLDRGTTFRVIADHGKNSRFDRVIDVEVIPKAPPPATPVQRAAEAARAAQAVKDTKRTLSEALADISELTGNDASARVLAHRAQALLNPAGPLTDEARKLVAPLARALQTGDAAKIARAAKALETKAGLRRIDAGAKPELIDGRPTLTLDRATQEVTGAADSGRVWLVRPGYKVTVDGREVVIVKAQVQGIPHSAIREAEQKAARAAARERNALIEARTGTARLLAEVDELISKKASTATIRERLDVKLTEPGQLFAGADPEVLKSLRAALASDDPAALRSAVTRAGTKAKVKPISRAGAKAKYDPATMEPVAGDIPAGAQVTVVRRGSTLTLPDGKVIQLEKARVTAVAKPVDPAVAKAQAHGRAVVDSSLATAERARVVTAMDAQAAIAPKTVMRLKGVTSSPIGGSFGKYMPALRWGSPLNRNLDELTIHVNQGWAQAGSRRYQELLEKYADAVKSGYFNQTAAVTDPLEYTVSHEFGHHVMRMMSIIVRTPSGVEEYLPVGNARLLLKALDDNLGTSFMTNFEMRGTFRIYGGRMVADPDYLDTIVARDGKKLAKLVSGYGGAGKFHETMAEIWALYSLLGDAAPIEIRRIGDLMRRLSEKLARTA
jgi:hypothetical protein